MRNGKAFFFSSYPEGSIAVETWNADTDELMASDWLFSTTPMPAELTYDDIANKVIDKIFNEYASD